MSTSQGTPGLTPRRSGTAVAAFVFGIPLAVGILYVVHYGPLQDTLARRYLHHPVECAEILLFCCALSALGAKLWNYWVRERLAVNRASRGEVLPSWDGKTVTVDEAPRLLGHLQKLPTSLQSTFLASRVGAVLDFIRSRRSAEELDDQLRTLTDADALALEGSYSLTRFITWAIPILGFLGTVLGITGAISGVTPEVLEQSLSTVTDGLALAFDATALGLALTMVTMFLSFLVERAELGVLEAVDRYVDRELAHRFERMPADSSAFVAVVRQNTQILMQATEQLVQKQAEIWAKSFAEVERRRVEAEQHQQQKLTASLEGALSAALERTLETHARRLATLEKHAADQTAGLLDKMTAFAGAVRETGRDQQAALTTALTPLARGLAAQAEGLARLQTSEKQLVALQESLNGHLAILVGAVSQASQGLEFRMCGSEFRLRLEAPAAPPQLHHGGKSGKPGVTAA